MSEKRSAYHFKLQPRPETDESRAAAKQARSEGRRVDEWFVESLGVEPQFTAWGGELPFPVTLRLSRDRHGRLAVTRLLIEGGEASEVNITSTSLRQVGAGLSDLLRLIAEHRLEDPAWSAFLGPLLDDAAEPYSGLAIRPGRRGHSQEFFREVGEGYAAALAEDPARPYTLLARRLFRSESQARRLVKRSQELFPELFEGGTP